MFHAAFLNPFDVAVYHLVNGMAGHSQILDAIMIFFAKYALELYALLFVIAWFTLPRKDIQNRHALFVAGLSGVLALIINVVISHIWFRPRPFTVFQKGTFTQLVSHSKDASFPSDHASGSWGFASASWGHTPRWVRYSFTILAILVSFARVFVGVHYPTDVLAGLLIGFVSSRIMWKFAHRLTPITVFVARLFRFGPSHDSQPQFGHGES